MTMSKSSSFRSIRRVSTVALGVALAWLALTRISDVNVPVHAQSSCGALINPIVCENQKAGDSSSIWDISGAGDSSIQGFATSISVTPGQTESFKIDTNSNNYTIAIYRMGYYGGMGARKIATITPSATLPQNQPNCLTNAPTGLIDCGNWAVSASWAVPVGCRVRHLLRPADTDRQRGKEPHPVRRSRERYRLPPLGRRVSNLGYDLAGLQPIRRQQPLRWRSWHEPWPRLQGELQPSVYDARHDARGLPLQRRIPDGALARGEWVRRQLHQRCRHAIAPGRRS